jgi:hypothetical protein
LGQCQLWLLCFIFHVAILLSWQPRTAPLKKDQERQPVNKLKDGKQRSLHLLARGSVFLHSQIAYDSFKACSCIYWRTSL